VQDIDTACRQASQTNHPDQAALHDAPFGGLHFMAFGDFAQHQPVKGRSLIYGASKPDYLSARSYKQKGNLDAVAGRRLWTNFDECIILKEQHRFGSDADGQALYDIVRKLTCNRNGDGTELSYTDIADLADTINSRAISPADLPDFLKRAPKAVVLRHSIRPPLTKMLVLHHASMTNSRVCLWRAADRATSGGRGKFIIDLSLYTCIMLNK
jgi:hypothetical protein